MLLGKYMMHSASTLRLRSERRQYAEARSGAPPSARPVGDDVASSAALTAGMLRRVVAEPAVPDGGPDEADRAEQTKIAPPRA